MKLEAGRMAAEAQVWVEGGESNKLEKPGTPKKKQLEDGDPATDRDSGGGKAAVTNGEAALSVISDNLSEEYSSDSGKGGSDTTVTPPDSISGTEQMVASWQMCPYTSYTTYSKSLGAVMPNHPMIFEFEIPQHIVGRLIGRCGSFVNKIKGTTGANIIIKRHPNTGNKSKVCAVEGTSDCDCAIARNILIDYKS